MRPRPERVRPRPRPNDLASRPRGLNIPADLCMGGVDNAVYFFITPSPYLGRLVRLGETRQRAEILVSISSRYGIVSYRIILAIVLQRLVTA